MIFPDHDYEDRWDRARDERDEELRAQHHRNRRRALDERCLSDTGETFSGQPAIANPGEE